jgi:hypothetical protein
MTRSTCSSNLPWQRSHPVKSGANRIGIASGRGEDNTIERLAESAAFPQSREGVVRVMGQSGSTT